MLENDQKPTEPQDEKPINHQKIPSPITPRISERTNKSISISLSKSHKINNFTKGNNNYPESPKSKNSTSSEITVKQFLDLLKTAYQVHDNLETLLLNKGMTDVVDWMKQKGVTSAKPTTNPSQTDRPSDRPSESPKNPIEAAKALTENLNIDEVETQLQDHVTNVINEGIMDSVLPLIIPAQGTTLEGPRPSRKLSIPKSASLDKISCTSNGNLRKKSVQVIKSDSEVEIHVCDEVKNLKKDFLCNQKLLVEQMGYFADVTKEQRLEDMDISVHCDITIFEWLMRWIKRDVVLPGDEPTLEITNAVPILVSASFLQMEPLVNECLHFCHKHMNDIVKTSSSLSCLNDAILTRLAAMYTNTEVETIKDRKDKIQSKLYCKLIQSLCEIDNEALRGHYCTMARVYRCKNCQQLINPKYGKQIPCVPSCMGLEFDGSVKNKHQRDPEWDINEYITGLYKNLKTWRKVYWRLWGICHFLYCNACKKYFPVWQEGWCRFHPDLPQFFTLDTQKPPLPVGRYPCCGERAYRFQILEDRSGCQFREHTISTTDIKDAAIAGLLENMKHLITEDPPKLVFPDRLTRLIAREPTDPDDSKLETRECFWWDGLELVPMRPKLGLLNELESDDAENLDEADEESEEETRSETTSSGTSTAESEESVPVKTKANRKKPKKKPGIRQWQVNLSSRSNQDMQRLHEEAAFKKMTEILNARTKLTAEIESAKNSKNHKPGGVWVRLESEWREKNMPAVNKSKNIYNGKIRMKSNRYL